MHMQRCCFVNIKLLLFSHPRSSCRRCCLSSLILRCNYCNRGHLDKVDQSDHRKITIHSKKVGYGPIRKSKKKKQTNKKLLKASNLNIDSKHFSRKQNVSPDNVFLFKTFHITPMRHIVWDTLFFCHLPAISSLSLPHLATRSQPQVKNITNAYIFRHRCLL